METCVLIPQQLSLVLSGPLLTVWTNTRITQGTIMYPFQGTIRMDKLDVYDYLDDDDIRHSFGCYDDISGKEGRRTIRHCNWVRFLHPAPIYREDVNIIGRKIKGEPIYEAVKTIPANSELIAYYLPERSEEMLFLPAVQYLRNSLYRRTMDTILEDSPLDLSMTLLSRVLINSSTSPSTGDEECSNASSRASEAEDLCPTTEQRRISMTARSRGERSLLPCEVCGKAFDRPSLLKRHMRTHTGEKPHVCLVCSKGFSTSSSLNTHRRIHSGEKPHQCQVCGKRFTASSNLYYHRMTHIKEKPHKCSLCAKSFPTPGDLKSHMYVHNGSWPFKCHICNRGFSKHTNLKNHLFLHTGDKPHTCDLCNKKFALACNLRAHLKTHEGDPQEDCTHCGKMYLTSCSQINPGLCTSCLNPASTSLRSCGDSGSEESSATSSENTAF